MTNLKKMLAGALCLCMAGSMLTACGSDSDSSSKKSGGDAATSDNGGSADLSGKDSKKVYNIYCWNDEFKSRFEKYYWDQRDQDLWDGVEVNWVINANEGNVYQTKLDEALKTQTTDDMKIDMFLVEADYALKYCNSDATMSIADIGLTDDDTANMYQYTKDVMTASDGSVKGVSWQATPGLFMYNAKYARDVLGTDDPAEVQEYVKDWDAFKETAQKMKDAGIYMVSGFDDTYRCFSNTVSSPWVDADGKITVDPQIKAWVDQTKEYTDAGYNNKTSLWDDDWKAGQKIDGKVFGYFFSTWGIPFTLLPNTLDTAVDDGGKEEVGNGGYGEWRATEGPQSYFWGGTWLCGCATSDNVEITKDIMLKMTCDTATMKAITEGEQDYTNNKAAIQELIDGGYTNPFLGGQDHLALLTEAADKIDLSNKLSAYDQGCNEKFQAAMKDYFLGNTASYDDALAAFKTEITNLYGNLTMD